MPNDSQNFWGATPTSLYTFSILFQIMPNNSHLPPQPFGTSKHIMIIPCKTTRRKLKRKVKAYSTCCSQAVTHPSTWQAQHCLTSVIGREPVYSVWYGRRQWSLLVVYFYVGFHLRYKCITYSLVLLGHHLHYWWRRGELNMQTCVRRIQ